MRKLQVLFGLAIIGLLSTSAFAAPVQFTRSLVQEVPNAVVLTYDPADGHLSVGGNGLNISTLEMTSAGAKFIPGGIPAGTISPPFDVATAAKIFKLSTGGFPSLDLGLAYPGCTAKDAILADLLLDGWKRPSVKPPDRTGGTSARRRYTLVADHKMFERVKKLIALQSATRNISAPGTSVGRSVRAGARG